MFYSASVFILLPTSITPYLGRPSRTHIHDEERREAAARVLAKKKA